MQHDGDRPGTAAVLAEDRLRHHRNAVPNDPRPPMVTAGLRIGTPALATRGFAARDFEEVADVIVAALQPELSDDAAAGLRSRVESLAAKHPLYPAVPELSS